ncbi:MAG: hypothetical protein ACOC3T_00045 [Bacteroidota bacterium]
MVKDKLIKALGGYTHEVMQDMVMSDGDNIWIARYHPNYDILTRYINKQHKLQTAEKLIKALGGYTSVEYHAHYRSGIKLYIDEIDNHIQTARRALAAENLIQAMETYIYGKQPRDSKGRYVSNAVRKKEIGTKLLEYARDYQGKYKGVDITV